MNLEKPSNNLYQELVEQLPVGILLFEQVEVTYANKGFLNLVGYSKSDELTLSKIIAPDAYADFICIIEDWIEQGPLKSEFESQVLTKRGNSVDVMVNLEVISSGETRVLCAVLKNITRVKIAETQRETYYREVQVNLEYFDNLFERLPLGAFLLDFLPLGELNYCPLDSLHREVGFKASFQRVNENFTQLLGYSNEEMRGKSLMDEDLVSEFQCQVIMDQLRAKRTGAKGSYEVILNHKEGPEIPVLLETIPILFDPDEGVVKQVIGILVDQTERKKFEADIFKLNRELQALSRTDGLTALLNRRIFDETLESEFKRAQTQKKPLSLIMVDIDYFKPYNDTYGHVMGDQTLREVANLIQQTFRRQRDLVARYGGEEFAVILPATEMEHALRLAEELRARVEKDQIPHKASKVGAHVTISVGVATNIDGIYNCAKELVEGSDLGLYLAKEEGRNCVRKGKA
ncbi:MAG: sensor domain-containing diguanylate cyclase [SAR324 cluster bacterium]|nr:sensor domain-containing diguanylate cyclase [SAR324 cluster bacterium]